MSSTRWWASFIGYGHPDRITSQYSEWFLITYTCIYIIFRNCTIKYQNCHWWNVLYYTSQNRVVTLSQTRTLENANSKHWFVFFNVSCWYEYSGYWRKNIYPALSALIQHELQDSTHGMTFELPNKLSFHLWHDILWLIQSKIGGTNQPMCAKWTSHLWEN